MRAALFDLDGVIIDTEPSYSIFWRGMGRKYGVGINNFADVIKGTTLTQILDRYFPDSQVRAQVVEQLVEYEKNMQYAIFPGVMTFLAELAKAGIPCAIVTSSNLEKMANLWRQHPDLKNHFAAIITDEDVTHSKPDPEPYLVAASRLGCRPEDTWVFEDSFNGILSGQRAGAKVVALATTNPREALVGKAPVVIDSFQDISPRSLISMMG